MCRLVKAANTSGAARGRRNKRRRWRGKKMGRDKRGEWGFLVVGQGRASALTGRHRLCQHRNEGARGRALASSSGSPQKSLLLNSLSTAFDRADGTSFKWLTGFVERRWAPSQKWKRRCVKNPTSSTVLASWSRRRELDLGLGDVKSSCLHRMAHLNIIYKRGLLSVKSYFPAFHLFFLFSCNSNLKD